MQEEQVSNTDIQTELVSVDTSIAPLQVLTTAVPANGQGRAGARPTNPTPKFTQTSSVKFKAPQAPITVVASEPDPNAVLGTEPPNTSLAAAPKPSEDAI